jgi:AcrR family transcriptional regulator
MSIDRRRQILDVALKAFSTSGYHNTSMTDIADALSMTKPVVYQYFDSKRELYLELLQEVRDQLVSSVTAVLITAGEPRAQVENGIVAYFTWVANNPDAFSLLFDSSERVDVEVDDIVSEFEDTAAQAIAPFITADISEDDQHTFAIGIVGMVETVSRQVIRHGRPINPDQLGHSVADLLWGGLRSIGQPRNTQPR